MSVFSEFLPQIPALLLVRFTVSKQRNRRSAKARAVQRAHGEPGSIQGIQPWVITQFRGASDQPSLFLLKKVFLLGSCMQLPGENFFFFIICRRRRVAKRRHKACRHSWRYLPSKQRSTQRQMPGITAEETSHHVLCPGLRLC